MTIPIEKGLPPPEFDEGVGAGEGVARRFWRSEPGSTEASQSVSPRLKNWLVNSVYPILRNLRNMANESSTDFVTNAVATYEWDLDSVGVLILRQTTSATLVISVAPTVDLTKLRPGRVYSLVLIDFTTNLSFSFSADFGNAGLSGTTRGGARTRIQFVVKDPNLSGAPTLIMLTDTYNSPLRLGYGAKATGSSSTAMGTFANASGSNAVAVGTSSVASGSHSVAFSAGAAAAGDNAIAVGNSANSAFQDSTAWGRSSTVTKDNQFKLGESSDSPYEEFIMSSAVGGTFYASDTPNVNGSFIGNNRISTEMGSTNLGWKSALATNAVGGFPCMPSSPGAPMGTPTPTAGMIPFEADSTNERIYLYINGAWQWVKLSAAGDSRFRYTITNINLLATSTTIVVPITVGKRFVPELAVIEIRTITGAPGINAVVRLGTNANHDNLCPLYTVAGLAVGQLNSAPFAAPPVSLSVNSAPVSFEVQTPASLVVTVLTVDVHVLGFIL